MALGRLVRNNKHRLMTLLGSVMLTSLVLTGKLTSPEEQRQRTSTFVDVGGSNVEALLHRRLHRLKNYIYDYEQIKDYTSSNISAMQNLNFLPAMKNPCFLTNDHILYEESGSERHGSRIGLSCLPQFYLLGFQKCGTSDFYMRILRHNDVTDASGRKEPHFWKRTLSFGNYTDLYRQGSTEIVRRSGGLAKLLSTIPVSKHHQSHDDVMPTAGPRLMLGDFSASSIYIKQEKIIEMHRLMPNAKLIIMMRDPSERALSHYLMDIKYGVLQGGGTAQDFHEFCERLIDCVNVRGRRKDDEIRTSCRGDWILSNGIYHAFIKRWLSVYPRENMLFVKFEDYIRQPSLLLQRQVVPFLDIDDLSQSDVYQIDNHWVNNQATTKVTMFKRTKQMLDDFYRPHNRWLVDLLGDTAFSWVKL